MSKIALTGHKRFVLLDANLVAGYYLPDSLSWKQARPRIENIMNAVRGGGAPEVFLFIPTLCIVEVFAVFSRYSYAKWDKQVKKAMPGGLDTRAYKGIRTKFSNDLHNGHVLQQVEFNRYHVLATDLISPVDAHFEYYRDRGGKERHKRMMAASDHAIIGQGIQLSKVHGRDNFAILTADQRFADILTRATSVKQTTAEKLGLAKTAKDLGLKYGPDIYPQVINLAKAKDKELGEFFGEWPLPTKPPTKRPTKALRKSDETLLAKLRLQSGIGRDGLPYTPAFESICKEFEQQTGRKVDRHEAWLAIGRVEKNPKKPKGTQKS